MTLFPTPDEKAPSQDELAKQDAWVDFDNAVRTMIEKFCGTLVPVMPQVLSSHAFSVVASLNDVLSLHPPCMPFDVTERKPQPEVPANLSPNTTEEELEKAWDKMWEQRSKDWHRIFEQHQKKCQEATTQPLTLPVFTKTLAGNPTNRLFENLCVVGAAWAFGNLEAGSERYYAVFKLLDALHEFTSFNDADNKLLTKEEPPCDLPQF